MTPRRAHDEPDRVGHDLRLLELNVVAAPGGRHMGRVGATQAPRDHEVEGPSTLARVRARSDFPTRARPASVARPS